MGTEGWNIKYNIGTADVSTTDWVYHMDSNGTIRRTPVKKSLSDLAAEKKRAEEDAAFAEWDQAED